MRVLEISATHPANDLSGVGTLVAELADAFAAAGHETVVWTRRGARPLPGVVGLGRGKLAFPLRAGWRMLRSGGRFDVVHVHESDGVVAVLALRLLRLFGRPAGRARIVATLQVSYREERRTTRPVRDRGEVVSRPGPEERRFALLRAPILALAGRITARLADVVVAPSRRTAGEIERDYDARDVLVLPNGVRAVEPRSAPPATPTILYAGRLRARKAVVVLIRAFAEVAERVPEARLVVAGDGEDRETVEAAVDALGLRERVERLGRVTREEVERRLRDATLFCQPSIYEGLPLAILEAMAVGVPVVATSVSGHPDAVVDGVTGWLVPPEDAASLASALVHALRDPSETARRATAASELFRSTFDVRLVAARHVALFESLAR